MVDGSTRSQRTPLEEARREMDRASADLERATRLLRERTEALASLEALLDHLLGMLREPVVVLDADDCVSAVSRGAADLHDLGGALGKSAPSVLPAAAMDDLAAARRTVADDSEPASAPSRVVALPQGCTLVVLDAAGWET